VEEEIAILQEKIKEEQQEMKQKKLELKKTKNETNVEEQEVAILMHKTDVGKDMKLKALKEEKYFENLITENTEKLSELTKESGVLRGFERVIEYIKKEERNDLIELNKSLLSKNLTENLNQSQTKKNVNSFLLY
jgi:hypothetical protein